MRIEIKIDDGEFVPLIDGPLIAQRMVMSAAPNDSMLTLVVQDDSVLLNQVETVTVFEELSAIGYRRDQVFAKRASSRRSTPPRPPAAALERARRPARHRDAAAA